MINRFILTPSTLVVLTLIIVVSLNYDNQASAQRNIVVEKTLDAEKDKLQKTMTDLENYEKIFPQYIKSAEIIQVSQDKTIAKLELGTGFIPISVEAEFVNLDDSESKIRVLSGDLKGSTITTTLEKTWSYNGIPNMGTNVEVDLSLEVSGFLALIGLITDDLIVYSIDKSLLNFVDYSKIDFQKNQKQVKPNNRSR